MYPLLIKERTLVDEVKVPDIQILTQFDNDHANQEFGLNKECSNLSKMPNEMPE